ncbi:peptidase C13 family-domain-containing protein [Kockovaella imperatae]|uniref:Peptidase C13 family-domain-containing protein n=1 Tax=Kockovaella imperatae TaxID=4999 RepID=A0A1Y1ULT4_9TREE|nr:peptidase C13 family-domain-containing protein [Kockovaella imperatae]ORX39020.1 peptidase C13 family-domain-containing protein [Kockovaella imperatae]
MKLLLYSLLLSAVASLATFASAQKTVTAVHNGDVGKHTNNWAILVDTSRYWFNYRHMANTLAMYRTIKRLGIPDSNIILMLADDVACNPRNPLPGKVYANAGRHLDLYGEGIEVDYRGYEVTVESFLRLLTGRHPDHTPRSKRLLSDSSSNVFIYMTGHGGVEFLKFQDNEEISAFDVADAIEQMSEKKRFNKLLFMTDTCQAATMYSKIYSPNVISTACSQIGENSYSHHNDMEIGCAVIDAYTHHVLNYLETINKTSKQTLQDLFDDYDPVKMLSNPGISTELSDVPPAEILVTDFFGGVASVEMTVPSLVIEFADDIKWPEAKKRAPRHAELDRTPYRRARPSTPQSLRPTNLDTSIMKGGNTSPLAIVFPILISIGVLTLTARTIMSVS